MMKNLLQSIPTAAMIQTHCRSSQSALGNLGLINGPERNPADTSRSRADGFRRSRRSTRWRPTWRASRTASGDGASLGITGDIALLQKVDGRLEAVTTAENLLFGGDANWLDTNQSATLQQWMTDFFTDVQSSHRAAVRSAPPKRPAPRHHLAQLGFDQRGQEFIDRWNRTVQYWSEGIFTAAQVPAGQSTDFLDIGAIQTAFNAAVTAEQESRGRWLRRRRRRGAGRSGTV